jgi:hypothetical protein
MRLRPMRGSAIAGAVVAVLLFPGLAPAAPPSPVQQVSSDPFSGDGAQHATQVEPDTFAFGSTVVVVFQSGRFVADGGSSALGFASSQDAGQTWTGGFLPNLTVATGGSAARVTDPSVAFDATHNVWLIAGETLTGAGPPFTVGYSVSRSTDGGLSWSSPIVAAPPPLDKGWVACDDWPSSPHVGTCYLVYLDTTTSTSPLEMVRSTDGGLTWSAPVSAGTGGLGAQPTVTPDGTVVITFVGPLGIQLVRSLDGGASIAPGTTLIAANRSHPPTDMRSPPVPSAEVDGGGTIYVAWQDCRFRGCTFPPHNQPNDIVYATSSTDGLTWSAPVRVPIDDTSSGVDHFIPGLAVDRLSSGAGAKLALTYYYFTNGNCTFATCQLNVGFISSKNAGTRWSRPRTLNATPMSLSWIADTTQGRMVGDYISTSFVEGSSVAIPAFSQATTAPILGVFSQSIWAGAIRVAANP